MLRRRAVQQRGCLVCSFYCSGTTLFICCLFGFNYSKDMLLYLFLSLSHFIGLIAGDTISPLDDDVTGTEGQSVKLKCKYETTSEGALLYWYKHHSDLQAPQFILLKGARSYSSQYIPDNRYDTKTTYSTTELTIKTLTLADTALYYCALDGYVRTGVVALTFGKAIRLNVVPSESSVLPPGLFVLSPLQPAGSSPATPGVDVCFATSFRPKGGEMTLTASKTSSSTHLKTNNAALHVKTKTYFFVGFTNTTIESCKMHNITVNKQTKGEVHCETKQTNNEIPAQETETVADIHPEQAKQNHYLLLMNGIRVVFTKTLAFNMLLTIRTLLF